MNNHGIPTGQIDPIQSMHACRLQTERTAAFVRIALAVSAAAAFLLRQSITDTLHRMPLEFVYLGTMGLVLLYGAAVLLCLKRWGYRRWISFASSTVDVSAISLSVVIILAYAGDAGIAVFPFTLAYSVYFPAILVSLRRYDPQNGLFAGTLAAMQYLAIVVSFRFSAVLALKYPHGPASWLHSVAPSELLKGVVLLLGGVFAYLLARSISRRELSTRQTEGALRVEQAYLSQFFESTPEAIVVSDSDTRVLRINAAFTKLFGYSEQEALGKLIDELVAPQHLAEEAGRLSRSAQDGQEFLLDTVRRRKDGSLVDVSILGAPIFSQGRQVAVFGIYRDVTERRRRERLFQALNQAAMAMQDSMSHRQIIEAVSGVFVELGYAWNVLLLTDGGTTLKIEHVSFEIPLVRSVEKLLSANAADLRIPVDCHEDVHAVIVGGETRFVEDSTKLVRSMVPTPMKGLAGRIVRMLGVSRTIGAPLMVEGRIIGLLSVHAYSLIPNDVPAITAFANQLSAAWQKVSLITTLEKNIAELQQTQVQLVQAQKMEAVGRLAGGIAHDFNNLLTVIRGYSELLLNEYELPDSVRETVEEIRKAGEQAADVTGHLLAFSRKQISRPRIVNINDALRSMEKILRRLIGEDIQLETRLEETLRPIRIDPHQIEQVIMNLAVNARDAMPEGGDLRIQSANVSVDSRFTSDHPEMSPGAYVLLSISDTGSGIEESILPQIFEPFFTTKERGRGTGLGLSTVYGIVKQSRGFIYVENAPRAGACFNLYFPPAEGTAEAQSSAAERTARLEGCESVLLVEDEPTVRQLTLSILERSGYRVATAASAEQALALTAEQMADVSVLITDIVMPGMNGKVLAKELQGRYPGLKVLFLTGYAPEITGVEESDYRDGEIVQKPFSSSELLGRLRRLIDEEQ